MLSIYSYAAHTWGGASSLTSIATAKSVEGGVKTGAVGSDDTSLVSMLARQLSEAAERAAARDASMSQTQLAALAKSLESKFFGAAYPSNKAQANAEVPDTNDPELLARAKQATKFVNGQGATNPFKGLSRQQLALIMYDQSDAFTINEHYAAYSEYNQQYQAWASKVCAQAQIEQQQTNTFTNFYKACIAEYMAASPIEQSTYHPEYVSRMEYYIKLWEGGGSVNFSPLGHETLVEMLLPDFETYNENLSWGLVSKLPMPEGWDSAGSPKAEVQK